MNTKIKCFSVLALMIVSLFVSSGIGNAANVPVEIQKVYINDREVENAGTVEIRGGIIRGDELEVEVKFLANGNDDFVSVEASIEGLDHDTEKATDKTDVFTVKSGKTYYKTLNVQLPQRINLEDGTQFALRVEISNRADTEVVYNAILDVDQARNSVMIKDVVFNPENSVQAGRALLASVRIKNMGQDTEDGVKISMSIPELGVSASDYVDELESEDSVTSEELYLRIPECADAGIYNAKVTVEYDDGDEKVSADYPITIVENEVCSIPTTADQGKTVVTIGGDMQDITAGNSGVIYPITLYNTGSAAKTYAVSAVAGSWANVEVSPSVVVLGAGETKIVYVSVAAKETATAGQQTFGVAIKSGDATLKEVTLKANVIESNDAAGWSKVKKGLEVALIVLVVLLVIIGLIIGFNRLKGDDDEDLNEETYFM